MTVEMLHEGVEVRGDKFCYETIISNYIIEYNIIPSPSNDPMYCDEENSLEKTLDLTQVLLNVMLKKGLSEQ